MWLLLKRSLERQHLKGSSLLFPGLPLQCKGPSCAVSHHERFSTGCSSPGSLHGYNLLLWNWGCPYGHLGRCLAWESWRPSGREARTFLLRGLCCRDGFAPLSEDQFPISNLVMLPVPSGRKPGLSGSLYDEEIGVRARN